MKVLVIGAGGTVGGAAAAALKACGDEIVGASRSGDVRVDVDQPDSIEALFDAVGKVDAVVCAVGHVPFKPLAELTRSDYISGFEGKTLSQLDVVRIGTPYVNDGGSFTLTTGILAREPIRTAAVAAMANGAVESFVMAAAVDMPRGLRINAVSPTVLVESPKAHPLFPGYPQVPATDVGRAYVQTVHGHRSGFVVKLDGR